MRHRARAWAPVLGLRRCTMIGRKRQCSFCIFDARAFPARIKRTTAPSPFVGNAYANPADCVALGSARERPSSHRLPCNEMSLLNRAHSPAAARISAKVIGKKKGQNIVNTGVNQRHPDLNPNPNLNLILIPTLNSQPIIHRTPPGSRASHRRADASVDHTLAMSRPAPTGRKSIARGFEPLELFPR
jgi:hypothetical protein